MVYQHMCYIPLCNKLITIVSYYLETGLFCIVIVAFLENSTIGYSLESVCVCVFAR